MLVAAAALCATLAHAVPDRGRSGAVGHTHSDSMKPAPDRLAVPDRMRPPGQHEKHRLPRVVNIFRIVEDLAAHPLDHRPMALDEQLECQLASLITRGQKPREQLPIR